MPGGVSGKKKKNSGPPPVPGPRGTLHYPGYDTRYSTSLVAGRWSPGNFRPASCIHTLHQINLAGVQACNCTAAGTAAAGRVTDVLCRSFIAVLQSCSP